MRRRARLAVLGGTFDRLHRGHRVLLRSAFRVADRVGIGITTDGFLADHPKPLGARIQRYRTRRRRLVEFLEREFPRDRYRVVPLHDPWGGSVDPGVDVLVVSEETAAAGRRVNVERRRRGLPPVRLLRVRLVRADDGRPISSRRIRARQIDPEGRGVGPARSRR